MVIPYLTVSRACMFAAVVTYFFASSTRSVTGTSAASGIIVRSPVQVTIAQKNYLQWEMTICADPKDANELTVGSMYERLNSDYLHNLAYYTSHDGGATWKLALDEPHHSDPTCAYDAKGKVYAAGMAFAGRTLDYRALDLYSSDDFGKTWKTATWSQYFPLMHPDRPWLAVDLSNSPHRGTAYFNAVFNVDKWYQPHRIGLFHSAGGGLSISSPAVSQPLPPGIDAHSGGQPGQVGILSDGTVVHAIFSYDGKVYITTSRDGGKTLSPFVTIGGSGKGSLRWEAPHLTAFPYHYIPMLAVDRSNGPFRDRVYVVWMDCSSGRVQMWLTYSLDKHARVWALPHPIDDAQAFDLAKTWHGPNDCNPAIAVNAAGILGVFWADRRDTPRRGYWPRFMASIDGGVTFTRSVPIGDHPVLWVTKLPFFPDIADVGGATPIKNRPLMMQVTSKAWSPFTEPGDHWGLAADAAGRFHPVWSDDRTGVPQVWTTTIEVRDNVRTLKNVTDDTTVRFTAHGYNAATRQATVDAVITNISNHSLPKVLLLKSLDPAEVVTSNKPLRESPLRATNADNGWAGPGAYWEFRAAGSELKPGQSTQIRRMTFISRTSEEPNGQPFIFIFAVR